MDSPGLVRKATQGANTLIISAGGTPFKQAQPRKMLSATAVDAVEPRKPRQLVEGYVALDVHELGTGLTPKVPKAVRRANLDVVGGKTGQLVSPYILPGGFLFKALRPISETSTVQALDDARDAMDGQLQVAAVFMDEGEFHFMETGLPLARELGIACMRVAGRHELLTIRPDVAVSMIFDMPGAAA